MAVGDKYSAVMTQDRAVPSGVATLDENGILSAVQRPNLAQVGGSNPNLLTNWYLADPICQRGDYYAKSGAIYYADTALTEAAGTLSAATKAGYVDKTYGTVTVSGTTHYVAYADMQKSFGDPVYTIDGWRVNGSGVMVVALTAEGVVLRNTTAGRYLRQLMEPLLPLRTYTFSVLVKADGEGIMTLRRGSSTNIASKTLPAGVWTLVSGSFTTVENPTASSTDILPNTNGVEYTLKAAKLELGPVQTLARQEADGSWVLNDPPPDRAVEWRKCLWRYERIIARNGNLTLGTGMVSTDGSLFVHLKCAPKRAAPSLSALEDSLPYLRYGAQTLTTTPTSISIYSCNPETGDITLSLGTTLSSGTTARWGVYNGMSLYLNSDL